MPKKRMDVNWKRELGKEDLKPAVKRFKRYLEDKGLRVSTIPMYVSRVAKYLEFSGQIHLAQMILPDFAIISMTGGYLGAPSIITPFRSRSITKCSDRMSVLRS